MSMSDERRQFWLGHVQAWRGSGLTQIAYCQQHGLKPKAFSYWSRLQQGNPPLTLVPVAVQPALACAELRLQHSSGWQLVVPATLAPEWLAGVLRGLGEC
ncbi:MAG: IS66 family insertion sequence element accessory protein TnpB [Gammaproteobacteria bacterium]|nr:IS66 family insertion sequence element accessory protein TnpB [Gammaproteobacteria bacterium]